MVTGMHTLQMLTMAQAADTFATVNGTSLDFGTGCTAAAASATSAISYGDTDGVFFGTTVANGGAVGGGLGTCTAFGFNSPGC